MCLPTEPFLQPHYKSQFRVFFFSFKYLFYVYVHCLHICTCITLTALHTCWCLKRSEEGIHPLKLELHSCVILEPLQKQQELYTAGPSFQPIHTAISNSPRTSRTPFRNPLRQLNQKLTSLQITTSFKATQLSCVFVHVASRPRCACKHFFLLGPTAEPMASL